MRKTALKIQDFIKWRSKDMESLKEMWALVCEHLKKSCGEVIYDIWFKPLEIVSFDGTKAEIAASEFVKRIIEQKIFVKFSFKVI